MDKTLIIMAAGMGSRYGGLKQLDGVGPEGETIIDYSVFDAQRAGFSKVVCIIRPDIEEEFKQKVGSKFSDTIKVEYAFQKLDAIPEGFEVPSKREKPWGTAHALLSAASQVDGPFIVINADDFYGKTSFLSASRFLDEINPETLHAALIGYRLKNTLSPHGVVSRGICRVDGSNALSEIEEVHGIGRTEEGQIVDSSNRILDEESFVSMNMWVSTPAIFPYIQEYFTDFLSNHGSELKSEFYIPDVISILLKKGLKVPVIETEEKWYGITYREDKPELRAAIMGAIERGEYPPSLHKE